MERHELRDRDDRGARKRREVDHVHADRHDVADDQTEEYGKLLPEGLREDVEEDAAGQRDEAEDPVLRRTEVRAAGTATEGCRTDAQQ